MKNEAVIEKTLRPPFILPHRLFKDKKYVEIFEKVSKLIWQRGNVGSN